ncbi:hypothetical protein KAT80_03905 [Candidatus Pacearchaeota archaeon]|nr:hypothetical protein [Candidatus Pacearchaeota archaeon]
MKKEIIIAIIISLIIGLVIGGVLFSQTEIIDNTNNSQLEECQEDLKECNLEGYYTETSSYSLTSEDFIGETMNEEFCITKQSKEFGVTPTKCKFNVLGIGGFTEADKLEGINVWCGCYYKE